MHRSSWEKPLVQAVLLTLLLTLSSRAFATPPDCTSGQDTPCGVFETQHPPPPVQFNRNIKFSFLHQFSVGDVSSKLAYTTGDVPSGQKSALTALWVINYNDVNATFMAQMGWGAVYQDTSGAFYMYMMPPGFDGLASDLAKSAGQSQALSDKCAVESGELTIGQCHIGLVKLTPSPTLGPPLHVVPGSPNEPITFTVNVVNNRPPNATSSPPNVGPVTYPISAYPNYTNGLLMLPLITNEGITLNYQCWDPTTC
jgi:hypothetical protein